MQIEANTKLQEIDCIAREESQVKIFKQIEELDVTATVGDVLEDGDTITVIKEDGEDESTETAPGSAQTKNLDNRTEDDIRVVLYNLWMRDNFFIQGKYMKALKFNKKSPWANKLELYRYWISERLSERTHEIIPLGKSKIESFVGSPFTKDESTSSQRWTRFMNSSSTTLDST